MRFSRDIFIFCPLREIRLISLIFLIRNDMSYPQGGGGKVEIWGYTPLPFGNQKLGYAPLEIKNDVITTPLDIKMFGKVCDFVLKIVICLPKIGCTPPKIRLYPPLGNQKLCYTPSLGNQIFQIIRLYHPPLDIDMSFLIKKMRAVSFF